MSTKGCIQQELLLKAKTLIFSSASSALSDLIRSYGRYRRGSSIESVIHEKDMTSEMSSCKYELLIRGIRQLWAKQSRVSHEYCSQTLMNSKDN